MTLGRLVWLLLVFSVVLPIHATNIITNGSFDATGTAVGGFSSNCTTNCPSLPGWTVQFLSGNGQIDCVVPGSAQGFVQNSTPTSVCTPGNPPSTSITRNGQPAGFLFTLWSTPGASPDGGNYFLVDGGPSFSGTLSQTVNGLHVGSIYNLTFWTSTGQEDCLFDDLQNCDPPGGANLTQSWQVTFGSTVLNTPTITTTPHTSTPWTKETLQFTATAVSQALTFFAKGTPDSGPPILFLDGIDLEQQAPEPDTNVLLALGLVCGIGGRAVILRRRKRRVVDPPA